MVTVVHFVGSGSKSGWPVFLAENMHQKLKPNISEVFHVLKMSTALCEYRMHHKEQNISTHSNLFGP
jgi:hypothetical protein